MKSQSTSAVGANPLALSLRLKDELAELADRQRALNAIECLIGFDPSEASDLALSRNDLSELVMAVSRSMKEQLKYVNQLSDDLSQSLRQY